MAIAFVQETLHSTVLSPGTTQALTVTNAPGAGNLLIVSASTNTTATVTSVTDNQGNTWTVDATTNGGGASRSVSICSTVQNVGVPTTITLHWSAAPTRVDCVVHEFSGCTNTVDQTAVGTATGTARSGGTTAATTNANDLVWGAFFGAGTATSFTAGAGYTAPTPGFYSQTNASISFEYKIVAATGTQNPTGTSSGSFASVGATVVYKAAASSVAYNLTVDPASFAVTGDATTLPTARKVSSSPGSFAVTGSAITPPVGRKLTTSAGSYAITGSATTLRVARKLSVSAGSMAITGNLTKLAWGRSFTASAGSFIITGSPVTPKVGRTLSSTAGSYAITGAATKLPVGRKLTVAIGSVSITGAAADLVGPGTLVVTVPDVPFIPLAIISHSI